MKVLKNDKGETIELVPEDTLNKSIIAIRVALQKANLKKTGKNTFSNFDYYQLEDFLPKLNELMLQEEVNDIFTIEDDEYREYAKLILVKGDEKQEYKIPFTLFETPLNWKFNKTTKENEQVKSMQDIQYLGALNTYYKRYLYLNAFGITDGEIIDNMDNDNLTSKKEPEDQPKTINEKKDVESAVDDIVNKNYEYALKISGQNEQELLDYFKVEKRENLTNEEKQYAIAVMNLKTKKAKNILDEASEQLKEEGLE